MVTKEMNINMAPNLAFAKLASEAQIQKVTKALEANGIKVLIAETGEEAKNMVLGLVPQGAEVYSNMSKTLDTLGLSAEFDKSGRYNAVRPRVLALDRKTQADEIRKLRTIPDYIVGSVHAITEAGEVLTASGTGSQISSYAYGAGKVIWVVGTQKIVSDLSEGFRRIKEYSHPLEDARMQEAYGVNSSLNKILVLSRDMPGRITIVLVKEELGF
ncbi:MAG TPA: LUD domain-containing protein [Anaerolineales bacterium]|nr:LUD domain-containing protein [Anaerolineales bacterium]HNO95610.1 LUD domain-containing protein [Anaerolineales bacterium]